jgi:hypothetical protein
LELKDFDGKQMNLSGVGFGQESYDPDRWGEVGSTMTFILDGTAYRATEDPNDGYRSSMSELAIVPAESSGCVLFGYNILVKCQHRSRPDNESERTDDILELIDVSNDKVVLEVGTADTGDYYPSYVANWNPQNLSINVPEIPTAATVAEEEKAREQAKEAEAERQLQASREAAGWGEW